MEAVHATGLNVIETLITESHVDDVVIIDSESQLDDVVIIEMQ